MNNENRVPFRLFQPVYDNPEPITSETLTEAAQIPSPAPSCAGQPDYDRPCQRPLAYVTIASKNKVSLVEILTGRKVLDIPVGRNPEGIVMSPDRKLIYTANAFDATLSVISTRSNQIVHTIELNTPSFPAANPFAVTISPDGGLIYTANIISQNISVVDARLRQVTAAIGLEDSPSDIDITPDGRLALVPLDQSHKVAIIDLKANLPVKYVTVGKLPTGVAVAKRTSLALVSNWNDCSLSAINTLLAESSPNMIDVNKCPANIIFAPGDKTAYVANWRDNNVGVVDVFSHRQTKSIPVGLSPLGMALTANGRLLIVCNAENDSLSVIDTDTLEVAATIPLDAYPRQIVTLE